MSDPLSTARTARESLARGLNFLQADPSVPSHLVDLAAPIAQAMGALHQLEKTNQLAPHADVALNHVRGALAQLQAAASGHPAVTSAMESVAQSLSLVHTLSRLANMQAAPPAPAPAPAPMPQAAAPAQRGNTANIPAQPAMRPPSAPAFPAAQAAPPPQQAVARDPFAARDPFGAPPPGAAAGPPPGMPPAVAHGAAPPDVKPATPSMPVPAPPPVGNMQMVTAELGAHSPTNFYKGLAGNDIVDHGGLFVSTYVSPKIGAPIRLKVSLPGGYEFEANAVVKWTREQGGDAPPGFGAQFTGITPEARQLVYRYVRNREPIFYDDL